MCHQAAINRIRDIGCADMKTTDPARIVSIYGIKVVLVLTTRWIRGTYVVFSQYRSVLLVIPDELDRVCRASHSCRSLLPVRRPQ
jgi:hypothetical protein